MRLLHYTANELELPIRSVEQMETTSEYCKPKGFWLSVEGEGDWHSWCEGNSYDPGEKRVYEVELASEHRVGWLRWSEDIPLFTQRYGRQIDYGSWKAVGIDWLKVAGQYDGLIIAPYQWKYRLSHSWYHGWDCASGCIWNAAAIASARLVGTVVFGGEVEVE